MIILDVNQVEYMTNFLKEKKNLSTKLYRESVGIQYITVILKVRMNCN